MSKYNLEEVFGSPQEQNKYNLEEVFGQGRKDEKTSVWEDIKATGSDVLGNLARLVPMSDKVEGEYEDISNVKGPFSESTKKLMEQGLKVPKFEQKSQKEKQDYLDELLSHGREDYEKKDPGLVGTTIQGAGRIAPAMIPGVGIPAALGWGASMVHGDTQREYEQLIEQGISEEDASNIRNMRYVTNAAGQLIPHIGKQAQVVMDVVKRSAIAGTVNAAIGAGEDTATKAYLEGRAMSSGKANIYRDVAESYNPFDVNQRGAEFILGGGPGTYRRFRTLKSNKEKAAAAQNVTNKLATQPVTDPTVTETVKTIDTETKQVKPKVLIPSEFIDPTKQGSFFEVSAESDIATRYKESLKGQQDLPFTSEFRPPEDPTQRTDKWAFPKTGDQLDLFGPENTKKVEAAIKKDNAEALRIQEDMTLRAQKQRDELVTKRSQEHQEVINKVDQILKRLNTDSALITRPRYVASSGLPALLKSPMKGDQGLSLTEGPDAYARILDNKIQSTDQQRTNPLTGEKLGAFKTKETADAALRNRGLDNTHVVVPVDGGYILRPVAVETKLRKGKAPERKNQALPDREFGIRGEKRNQPIDSEKIVGEQRKALKDIVPVPTVPETAVKWTSLPFDEARVLSKEAKDIPHTKGGWRAAWANVVALARDTGHPILRWLSGAVDKADARARNMITDLGMPFAETWQKLTDTHKVEVLAAVVYGKQTKQWLTPEQLKNAGLSDEQIKTVQALYNISKESLKIENMRRAEKGLEPIKEHPGYFPSNWFGDFTSFVIEVTPEGRRILDVISVGTEKELKQAQDFYRNKYKNKTVQITEKNDPELGGYANAERLGGGARAIMKLLDSTQQITDPKFESIRELLKQIGDFESSQVFGHQVHELTSTGVGGYEGAKPWKTPSENASDFFNSVVSHLEETAYINSHDQYLGDLKSLQAAPELLNQPNLQSFLGRYYDKMTHRGLSNLGRELNKITAYPAYKLLGWGPGKWRSFINGTSNVMSPWMLSSTRHFLTQVIQPAITGTPMLHAFNEDIKRNNPLISAHFDLVRGEMMMNSHLLENATNKKIIKDPVWRAAFDYADYHGITSFSGFDQIKERGKSLNQNKLEEAVLVPQKQGEALSRPAVFYAAYNAAIKTGIPIPQALDMAHNVTTMAMFGYKDYQAPLWSTELGHVGQQAMRLKKFQAGLASSTAYLAKHNKKAFGTLMANMVLFAGVTGTLPIETIEEFFGIDLTNPMEEKLGSWIMFGSVPALLGIDIQPSLSVSDPIRTSGNLPLTIAQTLAPYPTAASVAAYEGVKLAMNPVYSQFTNALKAIAPSGLKPQVDNIFNIDPRGKLLDKQKRPTHYLTEEDIDTRWYGMRSYEEGMRQRKTAHNFRQIQERNKQIESIKKDISQKFQTKDYTLEGLYKNFTDLVILDPESGPKYITQQFSPKSELMRRLSYDEQLLLRGKLNDFIKYQMYTRNVNE